MTNLSFNLVVTAVVLAASAQSAMSEVQSIEGVGISRDITCDGSDVGIYGANNTINLVGQCGNIVIDGTGHTVSFEKTQKLTVTGHQQKVEGGEATGLMVDGIQSTVGVSIVTTADTDAAIQIAGAENVVKLELAGPSSLVAQGYKHDIEWSLRQGVKPSKISVSGIETKIVQKK